MSAEDREPAAARPPVGFDANAHRVAILENWEEAASGWVRRQELLRELAAPVSHWMIEAIAPQPGQRVPRCHQHLVRSCTGQQRPDLRLGGGVIGEH